MSEKLPRPSTAIAENVRLGKKIHLNHSRNKQQDHTALLDQAAGAFRYEDCKDAWWNPREMSLLHGTPLWDEADETQRLRLNQLYWVAYYSQIISAEVATIFLNQTCAAGLYALEDFRGVCDMLDLESSQERAHINAFKTVSDQVEEALFGERVFSWSMRGPYAQTMIFPDTNKLKDMWRGFQLRTYNLLTSGNAFIASQYFTVRGLRTLNGKMVQHKLSQFHQTLEDPANAPIPAAISHYHFMDESYHFNSSCLIGTEVIDALPAPSAFEAMVGNMALTGCQRDHSHFSAVVNGLFWHEPATFRAVYRVLRSAIFGMEHREAIAMMQRCFAEENAGNRASFQTMQTAIDSYQRYLEPLGYVNRDNKNLHIMRRTTMESYLAKNRASLASFARQAEQIVSVPRILQPREALA
jgi:hypothetical protein